MNEDDKVKQWWTYDNEPTRWAIVSSFLAAWLFTIAILFSDIVKVLAAKHWWQDLIVALATVALPILAFLELRHSSEANRLRSEANDERRRGNELEEHIGELTAELSAERNKHLAQIAANTRRAATPAERNAETLRRHVGACVSVTEDQGAVKGAWPTSPIIAEVSEANLVTLFTPSMASNPQAWYVQVDCGELEIAEFPQGACPLRLHLRKRYGPNVQLGEGITKWEDRARTATAPAFKRGGNVHHATFSKQGSPETRSLHLYVSADGSNSFLLVPSVGDEVISDNVEISKRFMLLEINYRAAGFNRSGSGSGASPYPLFIW